MRIILLAVSLIAATAFAGPQSRVVLVRDPAALNGLTVKADRVRGMVSVGMRALTGQTNEAAAWQQLFTPTDVVGIKISTIAAPLQVTHQELIEALIDGLRLAGVAATNIVVFDRDPRKLRAAEYDSKLFQPVAIIGGSGWDPNSYIESKIAGKLIWGDLEFGKEDPLGTRSHLPMVLTRQLTKLINVPVLMDHDATGIANCLYNVSLGMTDNSRRFELYGQKGDPAIAEINAHRMVAGKLVLNICDALVAGYAGGPAFKPQYSWPAAALYFSRDPVAIDALCLAELEAQRKANQVIAIGDHASHVITCSKIGLGQRDPANIELLEVTP